jgi:hypothetical protein
MAQVHNRLWCGVGLEEFVMAVERFVDLCFFAGRVEDIHDLIAAAHDTSPVDK